jgi:chemotaxis protein MotB
MKAKTMVACPFRELMNCARVLYYLFGRFIGNPATGATQVESLILQRDMPTLEPGVSLRKGKQGGWMVRIGIVSFLACAVLGGCVSLDQYGALREAYNRVEAEIQAAKSEAGKTSAELRRAQQEAATLRQELTPLAKTHEDLTKQTKDLQAALDTLRADLAAKEREKAVLVAKEDEMGKTVRQLESSLKEEIAKGSSTVRRGENSLSVELAERILYDSGSADIKPGGLKVLKKIADALKGGADKDIRVEGHTDDVPIRADPPPRFSSNWDLSTARAVGVVRYLEKQAGVSPVHLSAAGFGPTRPAVPNESEEARARNRRVEIIVTPARPGPGPPAN